MGRAKTCLVARQSLWYIRMVIIQLDVYTLKPGEQFSAGTTGAGKSPVPNYLNINFSIFKFAPLSFLNKASSKALSMLTMAWASACSASIAV